jgi:hypothetical protein
VQAQYSTQEQTFRHAIPTDTVFSKNVSTAKYQEVNRAGEEAMWEKTSEATSLSGLNTKIYTDVSELTNYSA